MKPSLILITITFSAGIFPSQGDVKTRREQAPKTEAPKEEDQPKKIVDLRNKWGSNTDAQQVWNKLQKLLNQQKFKITFDDWKDEQYEQLATLREEDAPKVSKDLSDIAPVYIAAWGDLRGEYRHKLYNNMEAISAAVFGNAPLSFDEHQNLVRIINDIKAEYPTITSRLVTLLNKIAQEKQPKQVETAPEKKKTDAEIKKCLDSLRKSYYEDLEKQHKNVMTLLYETTGIDEKSIRDYMEQHRDLIYELSQEPHYAPCPPTHAFYKKALALFNKAGIDPTKIAILQSEKIGSMEATASYLGLNPTYCARLSEELFEVFLLHEMHHILFQDSLFGVSMRTLLQKKAPDKEQFFMQLWDYFKEKRADVYAYLTELSDIPLLDRVKADIEYWKVEETSTERHQSSLQRQKDAEKIYQEMLACYQ